MTSMLDVDQVDQLPDVDDVDQADAEAPYGRKADGTPRRKPGPPAGGGRRVSAPSRRRRTSRRPPAGGPPRAAAAPTSADVDPVMVKGAQAILGIPTRIAAVAGMVLGVTASTLPEDSPRRATLTKQAVACSADASTLILYGPNLATGIASLGDPLPWLAGVLVKAAQVSPYAAAIEAGITVGLQLLCNHGWLPATPMLGTVDPGQLIAQVMGQPAPTS